MTFIPARSRPAGRTPALVSPLLAALVCLATAPAAAQHTGISACPGSASLAESGGVAPLATTPLLPGDTLATLGTTLTQSPELAGERLLTESRPFDFMTPSGRVKGEVVTKVVDADNCSCDLYWQVFVSATSSGRIASLTLRGYNHQPGKPLVADYRADLGGQVAPEQVSRSSGVGSTIRFRFAPGLGAGEVSKPMFLNTRIAQVVGSGDLQVHGVGGGASPRLPTQMPSPP